MILQYKGFVKYGFSLNTNLAMLNSRVAQDSILVPNIGYPDRQHTGIIVADLRIILCEKGKNSPLIPADFNADVSVLLYLCSSALVIEGRYHLLNNLSFIRVQLVE